jgi:hypothetical protein
MRKRGELVVERNGESVVLVSRGEGLKGERVAELA